MNIKEKSAEIIEVGSNEPMERSEVSQTNEGLNDKLFLMRLGGSSMLKGVPELTASPS